VLRTIKNDLASSLPHLVSEKARRELLGTAAPFHTDNFEDGHVYLLQQITIPEGIRKTYS
jgi:hypothetical protein